MHDNELPSPPIEGLEITGLLGTGATSRVYLGIQTRFDRPVAVKVLNIAGREKFANDLVLNETRVLALLSAHPNILTLYDAGVTEDGFPYLITEYLPDGSLGLRLRRDGPLSPQDIARIGVELCGALATAHLHDVIHGDVKPDNVLTGRIGQPLLGDFGVAAIRQQSQEPTASVLTPLHAAPELLGGGPATTATDIYGLGSTLTALSTGFSPIGSSRDRPDVILGRLHDGVRVDDGREDVPEALLEVLDEATAREPTERFDDMSAFGRALQAYQRSVGDPETELHVMSESPELAKLPEIAALQAPDAELTVEPETANLRSPNRLLVTSLGVAVVVLTAALGIWFGVGNTDRDVVAEDGAARSTTSAADGDEASPNGGDPSEDREGKGSDPEAQTATTLNLPESNLAGVQPGIVTSGPEVPDTSAEIAREMTDEQVVFWGIPTLPADSPYYGVALHDLPVTFRYQGFNAYYIAGSGAEIEAENCAGMMSREITVTGLWERKGQWADGAILVAIADLADKDMAYELFTVLSVDIGVPEEDCWGLAHWNVTDYDDYGVEHRDVDGLTPSDAPYNLWMRVNENVAGQTWPIALRMVMLVDDKVVDLLLATRTDLPAGNPRVLSDVAKQIRARLIEE